jgi:hypothetical protein
VPTSTSKRQSALRCYTVCRMHSAVNIIVQCSRQQWSGGSRHLCVVVPVYSSFVKVRAAERSCVALSCAQRWTSLLCVACHVREHANAAIALLMQCVSQLCCQLCCLSYCVALDMIIAPSCMPSHCSDHIRLWLEQAVVHCTTNKSACIQ